MHFFTALFTVIAAAASVALVSAQEAARFGNVNVFPSGLLTPNENITITYNSSLAANQPLFVDFYLEGEFSNGNPAPNLLISRNDYGANQTILLQNATLPDFSILGNVTYSLWALVTYESKWWNPTASAPLSPLSWPAGPPRTPRRTRTRRSLDRPRRPEKGFLLVKRLLTAVATAVLLAPLLSACDGSADPANAPKTLTYWASNQGASLEADKQILQPELDKFERQTGIKVTVEVVPWSDLLNRLLAAATSGQGPDVVNIGNTWSASLQATGAFVPFDEGTLQTVGGKDRFVPAALASAGAPDQPPTAVPIYSLAYALYYNKKMFADAGISTPPATWEQLVVAGQTLTKGQQWGLAIEGANISENAHHAFAFSQQYGGEWFDATGKPTFDTPQNVAAIKRYIDFMAVDKISNPSNAEYAQNQSVADFANGKVGMLLWQAAGSQLKAQNMAADAFGVAPVPFPQTAPSGGKRVNSMVAGINMAVFKHTKNRDAALQFVKFMTSDEEQVVLNRTYGSLPSVKSAAGDAAFQAPEQKVLAEVLGSTAAPLPQVAQESQFETLVGTAMKDLFAQVASGGQITEEDVRKKLSDAQSKMRG
jgi:multiple sugar transport system substrate-binding protein